MENNELLEYRSRLIEHIRTTAQEFSDACRAVKDPYAPIEPGGWNTHQLAGHTRDVQIHVYGARARRTVEEDTPVFPNFDGDAWYAEHYRTDEPLAKILNEFLADVHQIIPWLEGLPNSAWSRMSRHEINGDYAMQTWVERMLAHIEEHLESVKKVI
jgi:hypothetical protein